MLRDFFGVLIWFFGLLTFSSSYIISALIRYSDFLFASVGYNITIPSILPTLCTIVGTYAMIISIFISLEQRKNLIGGTVVALGFPLFCLFIGVVVPANPVLWAIIVLPIAIPIIILSLLASSFGEGGGEGGYEKRIKHYGKHDEYKGYTIEKRSTTKHYGKHDTYKGKSEDD